MLIDPSISSASSAIRISSPPQLVAAVPHLLGFQPTASAVLVLARGGTLRLTVRTDLPDRADGDWAADVIVRLRAAGADRAFVVVYPGDLDKDVLASRLPRRDVADELRRALGAAGVHVSDALCVSGDRWWSYLCDNAACCRPEGERVDDSVALETASQFVLTGSAVLNSRDDLVAMIAESSSRAESVESLLMDLEGECARAADEGATTMEAWRDRMIRACNSILLDGDGWRPHHAAILCVSLRDIRVRDVVLFDLACCDPTAWRCAQQTLISAMRMTPRRVAAPVATALAIMSWQVGDGALATVALEAALEHEPDYRLARLMWAAVQGGLPPSSWIDTMRSTTRDACRHGIEGASSSEGQQRRVG